MSCTEKSTAEHYEIHTHTYIWLPNFPLVNIKRSSHSTLFPWAINPSYSEFRSHLAVITPMLAEKCLFLSYPSFIETAILHVVYN